MSAIFIPGWCHREGDLPRFERSLKCALPFDVVPFSNRTGLVEELHRRRPTLLIGWSLGAIAALDVARELPFIQNIVSISGGPRFTRGAGHAQGISRAELRLLKQRVTSDPARAASAFAALSRTEPWSPQIGVGSLEGLNYLEGVDLKDYSDIRASVLLIHGTADSLIPFEGSIRLFRELPSAHLSLSLCGGHDILETASNEVAGVIRQWLMR